ncbi:hypothetical protein L4C36_14305 [Photobacterium japonica]|uniref:hypothetical protein n=1 Tax=Photobacterium japonica TaxID=2910235 RepID=UPI003D0B6FEB
MTVIKSLLAVSAASLLLTACGSGSSDGDKNDETHPSSVQIKLIHQSTDPVQKAALQARNLVQQTDANGYQHLLSTDPYLIEVDEGTDGGENYTLTSQSFSDNGETLVTLDIVGQATVTVTSPTFAVGESYYTVTSVERAQCDAGDAHCHTLHAVPIKRSNAPIPVYLANTEWHYVTLPDSPILYDQGKLITTPTVGGNPMTKSSVPVNGKHHWYGYVSDHTEMQVATTEGFYSVPIAEDPRQPQHKTVTFTEQADGTIVLTPPSLEDSTGIAPIPPMQRYVASEPRLLGEHQCRELGGTYYSLKAFSNSDESCLIPSIASDAFTLRTWWEVSGYIYSPLPTTTTAHYYLGDSHNAHPAFPWSDSKQACYNDVLNRSADFNHDYQRAAFINEAHTPTHNMSCLAEIHDIQDISAYGDNPAIFSIEFLSSQFNEIQTFDLDRDIPFIDTLSGINCHDFTAAHIADCLLEQRPTFQELTFTVLDDHIVLPLKAFTGNETLAEQSHSGNVTTFFPSDRNAHTTDAADNGVFYRFAIRASESDQPLTVKVKLRNRFTSASVFVYDDNHQLIDHFTPNNGLEYFRQKYQDYLLVRNTANPDHSLELLIENEKGKTFNARGFDFSAYNSLQ